MSIAVVSEIKQFMRQSDLTMDNMERIESLMEGYTSAVREYNAQCGRVRELIKNNMVEELERFLNELDPPLQQQYKELRQPALKEFLETTELYGLEAPSLENPFDEIQGALLNNVGLRPLIIRYRQVARSKDIQAKVVLIRQILSLNPEDALDWERNLADFEEEWKTQLQEGARQAILAGDFDLLKQIQETMLEEPWKTPIAENVTSKIAQELAAEEMRAKKQRCEQFIAMAEGMIAQPDKLKDAVATMKKVDELLAEGVQLDSMWQQRYAAVVDQMQRLLKQAEADERFAMLFSTLDQRMNANAPVEQVDAIFYEMQRLRKEIPEITVRRVETYRQNAIMAAKRKKNMLLFVGVVVAILFLGMCVVVFRAVSRSISIEEYSAKLRTAIDDPAALSDTGFGILTEIEQKVPGIRNSQEIMALADELAAKRKSEEEKRTKFTELAQQLKTQLENYAENTTTITELMKELPGVALAEHKKELDELTQLHDEKRESYVRNQDGAYRKLVGEAGEAYIKMKTAMSEHRYDDARDSLPVIAGKLKAAAALPDVSGEAKSRQSALVEQYEKAEKTLNQGKLDFDVDNKLKALDAQLTEFNKLVTTQQDAEALALSAKIEQLHKEIEVDIKNASITLRSQYDSLAAKVKDVPGQLSRMQKLFVEEDVAILDVLRMSKLENVKTSLQSFQEKYPHSPMHQFVAGLLNDLSKSLDSEGMKEYDGKLHETSNRLGNLMNGLGTGLSNELSRRRNAYGEKPIFVYSFTDQSRGVSYSERKAPIDLYLNRSVKVEKKGFGNDFNISGSYILGMNENKEVKLVFGDNGQIFLTMDNAATSDRRLDNLGFAHHGYWGEWLLAFETKNYNFKQYKGWELLDRDMITLLRKRSDCVRIVHEWKSIVDFILKSAPEFQKGGEFELTELLDVKQELDSLMAIFPPGTQWYSASWEHQKETREFYMKLLDFNSRLQAHPQGSFYRMISRLEKRRAADGLNLVPCGILAWCKEGGHYSWFFMSKNLPREKDTLLPLYIADHGKKEGVRFGYYKIVGTDKKEEWNFDRGKELPAGYYVVFIRK